MGSAGSESGGSGADSITGEQNVSGRSSAYGDTPQEPSVSQPAVIKVDGREDPNSVVLYGNKSSIVSSSTGQ